MEKTCPKAGRLSPAISGTLKAIKAVPKSDTPNAWLSVTMLGDITKFAFPTVTKLCRIKLYVVKKTFGYYFIMKFIYHDTFSKFPLTPKAKLNINSLFLIFTVCKRNNHW